MNLTSNFPFFRHCTCMYCRWRHFTSLRISWKEAARNISMPAVLPQGATSAGIIWQHSALDAPQPHWCSRKIYFRAFGHTQCSGTRNFLRILELLGTLFVNSGASWVRYSIFSPSKLFPCRCHVITCVSFFFVIHAIHSFFSGTIFPLRRFCWTTTAKSLRWDLYHVTVKPPITDYHFIIF